MIYFGRTYVRYPSCDPIVRDDAFKPIYHNPNGIIFKPRFCMMIFIASFISFLASQLGFCSRIEPVLIMAL
jgi:hypothetical protein